MFDLKFAVRQLLKNPGFTAVKEANAATTGGQMLKSVFRRVRIELSKSIGRMPKRPVMTRVLRVQSLSVRTTERALRCVWLQDGCVGSTAMPKRGNLASGSVVINATTKSPGDSATPRTTHGLRFALDKSVNGKAARTISPACGMSAEIGILVAGFYIGIGIKIGLRREKLEGAALLRDSGHHSAGEPVIRRLRDHEYQPGKPMGPGFGWNAYHAGFIHFDRQRFHVPSLAHRRTLPSFCGTLCHPSPNSIQWRR
jgi:hypothetical protein